MNRTFQPTFLTNSPSTICDQILYLVKNSSLNFELHETPFSMNLKLKKSFAQHWKKAGQENLNHVPPQQYVSDPGHQPHHPYMGQPGHHPGCFPQQQNQRADGYNGKHEHLHQQHQHLPHDVPDHVHQSDHPAVGQPSDHLSNNKTVLRQNETLKAENQKLLKESSEASQEYSQLDKTHRKLLKDHRDLEAKHSKICYEIKSLKNEIETAGKENKELSVALKSSKKETEISSRNHEKEIQSYQKELATLMEFKTHHEEEIKNQKRLEKKMRQKARKKLTLLEDGVEEKADLENNFVTDVPVSNLFEPLGTESSAELEEKVKTDLDPTSVTDSNRDINSMTHPSMQLCSLDHTSTIGSSVNISAITSATTSLELNTKDIRLNPESCELSSQGGSIQGTSTKTPLQLFEDLFKKLSSKMDDSHLRDLEKRNNPRKQPF